MPSYVPPPRHQRLKTPTPRDVEVCLSCKRPEGPLRPGAVFEGSSEKVPKVRFWMCMPCAAKYRVPG